MIPKFRAWHITLKEMHQVYVLDTSNGNVVFEKDYKRVITEDQVLHLWTHAKDVVLMRSTGLKDTLSKEVFEGDIIRIEGLLYAADYVVKYLEWCATYYLHEVVASSKTGRILDLSYGLKLEYHNNKIIGNIYENPNLLDQK